MACPLAALAHRHVGDGVDLDLKLANQLGEDVAGEPVAAGVAAAPFPYAAREFQCQPNNGAPRWDTTLRYGATVTK